MKAKAFTDGSVWNGDEEASYGFIIKTVTNEQLAKEGRKIDYVTNPSVAEYKGIIEALKRANTLGVDEIHIAIDSKFVVYEIRGEREPSDDLVDLRNEVLELSDLFDVAKFYYINREYNPAHDIAQDAHLANSQELTFHVDE